MNSALPGGSQYVTESAKMGPAETSRMVSLIERETMAVSGPEPGIALHCGEIGFHSKLAECASTPESNALENLLGLKVALQKADTEQFWTVLMEGMTDLCNAQYGFVVKRILVDDHESAVEMPLIGEPGSCLMAVALYYNDGKNIKAMHRDYKYLAFGTPCGFMKHDKVFLIPNALNDFVTDNPNTIPFATEAYLGVPLFSDGKCFAHFGMMWTQEALESKSLSWAFIEMLMHALEDMITDRLVSGKGFSKPARSRAMTPPEPAKIIPREAITLAQSLKPYAKSLSHELRTPMQGVVGMLDVMHATVQEQIEGQTSSKIRQVFQVLRDNIEVVQDSSKRAVEAADNVVHAYDMNMQIPETPLPETDSPSQSAGGYFDFKPAKVIEGSNITSASSKRKRSGDISWQFGNATKFRHISSPTSGETSPKQTPVLDRTRMPPPPPFYSPNIVTPETSGSSDSTGSMTDDASGKLFSEIEAFSSPGLKHSRIRSLIPIVISNSLRLGGRPDMVNSMDVALGQRIEVRSRSSNGHVSQKTIEWTVQANVPDTILVDERDLAKLMSAVSLNAIKFTEQGNIWINVKLSESARYLLVSVIDTGDGIPEDFLPKLFKPFSQEDDSLTRSKEGLGLGLLVAKGLARRMGGDIRLVRSEVSGTSKGSEFEIKVSLDPESSSRQGTPKSRTSGSSKSSQSLTPTNLSFRQFSRFTDNESLFSSNLTSSPGSEVRPLNQPQVATTKIESPPPARKFSLTPELAKNKDISYDKTLAEKYPLTFLVAEDNKINRKLLVNMLGKFGYKNIYEAFDGKEAVRIMQDIHENCTSGNDSIMKPVDVILMDLWMPEMDGYQATAEIKSLFNKKATENGISRLKQPTILAVSADVTGEAINRATRVGMEGYMTKPYKLLDLQRLIKEFCVKT